MDRQIATLANNERLKDMLSDIWAQVFRIRRLATTNQQRLLESVDEHIQIIDAVAAGKADEAGTAVSNHIQNSLRNVLISVTPHMSS
jgi:DNA-binding GntR family transcriptional regulator